MYEFDPVQDVLADTERILEYASEHQTVARLSKQSMFGGSGLILIGLAEVVVESAETTGALFTSAGLIALMTGALAWGVNEFRHGLLMNSIE